MGEDLKPENGTTPQSEADGPAESESAEGPIAVAEESGPVVADSSQTPEPLGQSEDESPAGGAAPDSSDVPPPAEEQVPLAKFAALQVEKDELYDKLLRKQAEFENFRKRTEKEKQEYYDFALSRFIQGLLPTLDGLERGLSVTEGETVESYKKGIELILKQLRDHLAATDVQPIRATGQMFDPNLHQAVMREENAVLPENEIIEELQRGYTFKERLIRPSMVKVAVPVPALEPETAAEPEPATEPAIETEAAD